MKIQALKTAEQFKVTLSQGKRCKERYLSASVFFDDKEAAKRLGFIIPKKVVPSAVHRNYLKRVIKNFFARKEASVRKGSNIVVKVKEKLPAVPRKQIFQMITQELEQVGNKTGLYDKETGATND